MNTIALHGQKDKDLPPPSGEYPNIFEQKQRLSVAVNSGGFGGGGKEPPKATFDERFTFTSAAALEYVLDEINLVQDLLPASGLAAFYGEPGCGKSFGTIDLAVHLGAGLPFAGKRVEQAHVVMVVAEGRRRYRNRVKAAMKKLDVDPKAVALDLIHAAPNLGRGVGDAKKLIQAIKAQRKPDFAQLPLVIVIDTLARTMGGAKEDDEGIGMFVVNCGLIEGELGGLVIAVHHTGKDATRGMRGHSGLHGACDCEWLFTKTENGHSVLVAKFRDEACNLAWDFALERVEIGKNKHQEPMTTCVVNLMGEPAAAENAKAKSAAPKKPRSIRVFDEAFNEAAIDYGEAFFVDGDGPQVQAVQVKRVRDVFAKRYAVSSDDEDEGLAEAERKRRRDKATSEAFRGIIKKTLPPYYRTEARNGVEFIWKLN